MVSRDNLPTRRGLSGVLRNSKVISRYQSHISNTDISEI